MNARTDTDPLEVSSYLTIPLRAHAEAIADRLSERTTSPPVTDATANKHPTIREWNEAFGAPGPIIINLHREPHRQPQFDMFTGRLALDDAKNQSEGDEYGHPRQDYRTTLILHPDGRYELRDIWSTR